MRPDTDQEMKGLAGRQFEMSGRTAVRFAPCPHAEARRIQRRVARWMMTLGLVILAAVLTKVAQAAPDETVYICIDPAYVDGEPGSSCADYTMVIISTLTASTKVNIRHAEGLGSIFMPLSTIGGTDEVYIAERGWVHWNSVGWGSVAPGGEDPGEEEPPGEGEEIHVTVSVLPELTEAEGLQIAGAILMIWGCAWAVRQISMVIRGI